MHQQITIDEAPNLVWSTNLSKADIVNAYKILILNPSFLAATNPHENEQNNSFLQFRLGIFNTAFEYADGICVCIAQNQHITITFMSYIDWELFQARSKEEESHSQQQETESEISELIFKVEDNNYAEVVERFTLLAEFESASEAFFKWIDFRQSMNRSCYDLHVWFFKIFGFVQDVKTSLLALRRLDLYANAYFSISECWTRRLKHDREHTSEILKKIFDQMIEHHAKYWICHKECCLWLERNGFIDLAIEYCERFAAAGSKDDTKSGYQGRLKRLYKKKQLDE